MMSKKIFMLILATVCCSIISAQSFSTPTTSFSKKKTAHITYVDGEKTEGTVNEVVTGKKGMITHVKFTDTQGKKHEIPADEIMSMYVFPSKTGNISRIDRKLFDRRINDALLSEGYVYFEGVDLGNKTYVLLQLANPTFSKGAKLYHDPKAKNSGKSYYIKLRNEPGVRYLKESKYKKTGAELWEECDVVGIQYPEMYWDELRNHIVTYIQKCLF